MVIVIGRIHTRNEKPVQDRLPVSDEFPRPIVKSGRDSFLTGNSFKKSDYFSVLSRRVFIDEFPD